MPMLRQRTIGKPMTATGIGLHSGRKVTVSFRPAPADTGLVYTRVDLDPQVVFRASADAVRDTQLCTALVNADGVRISTVEHLSAALCALGIDNLYIDVDAPEIPVMDGSAYPFLYLFSEVGVKELKAPKKFIKITRPIRVEDGDKWALLEPADSGLSMSLTIDFDHPAMTKDLQHVDFDFTGDGFMEKVSKARTFCFLRDVEYMHAHNLALGGSLDNAVVLDEYRVVNPDGLRYADEFVRHKLLDAIGDLYMSNFTIIGKFSAYKTGHNLNNMLLRSVLAHEECREFVTFEAKAKSCAKAFTFLKPAAARS